MPTTLDARHNAGRRGRNRAPHGSIRQRRRIGIAARRADPPFVDRESRPVVHRGLGPAPTLVDVDPEVLE